MTNTTTAAKLNKTQTAALTWYATEGREGKLPGRGYQETKEALRSRGLIETAWEGEGLCRSGKIVATAEGRKALGL